MLQDWPIRIITARNAFDHLIFGLRFTGGPLTCEFPIPNEIHFHWPGGSTFWQVSKVERKLFSQEILKPLPFFLDRMAQDMAFLIQNGGRDWEEVIRYLVDWPDEEAALVVAGEVYP